MNFSPRYDFLGFFPRFLERIRKMLYVWYSSTGLKERKKEKDIYIEREREELYFVPQEIKEFIGKLKQHN